MPLDPQARTLLDQLAAAGRPPVWQLTPEEGRQGWDALAHLFGPPETPTRLEDHTVPGPAGAIPVRLYRPGAGTVGGAPLPVLVWFHGGGFVIGSVASYDNVCRALANRAECLVASVDYRLAPEHRFPAAIDDAYAATSWIAEHAAEWGGDPARVAVGGDSAGGCISCVVTQLARDRGGPPLAFQLLVYPGTDWDLDVPSIRALPTGYLLERDSLVWFRDRYLRSRDDETDPRASPLRAARLDGLPAAFVVTAEYDPIKDYGTRYVERLEAAGVPVEHRQYPGTIHAFVSLAGALDAGKAALEDCGDALRAAFAR